MSEGQFSVYSSRFSVSCFQSENSKLKTALRSALYALCFIWMTLLISVEAKAEPVLETGDPAEVLEGPATVEGFLKSPLPKDDPHMFYLLLGERMFRSRELNSLRRAREAFEKVLELDSQDAQAHYFLGLIEYEEGNIEKAKTRFQIAYECLGLSWKASQLPDGTGGTTVIPDAKQVQLEFPREYRGRLYYKDGWYVSPKGRAISPLAHESITDRPIDQLTDRLITLEAGSAYRVELRSRRKESWIRKGMIGLTVALSFFLAR